MNVGKGFLRGKGRPWTPDTTLGFPRLYFCRRPSLGQPWAACVAYPIWNLLRLAIQLGNFWSAPDASGDRSVAHRGLIVIVVGGGFVQCMPGTRLAPLTFYNPDFLETGLTAFCKSDFCLLVPLIGSPRARSARSAWPQPQVPARAQKLIWGQFLSVDL